MKNRRNDYLKDPFSRRYRVAFHLLYWVGVLIFYTVFFGHVNEDYGGTFWFVCLLLPTTMLTTYFLNLYLIPRFLLAKRYAQFILFLAYTILVSVYLELFTIVLAFILLGNYELANLNPATHDIFFLVVGMYLVVLLAIVIKLLRYWYQVQQANQKLQRDKLEAELRLRETELKFLRAQIHPHFLFNTLNNLYGLTLMKSELAPEMLIKLSELLHYILYECDVPQVSLDQELACIRHYIALEKLRYDENLEVNIHIKGNTQAVKIAPMLILPFVENSFKHGLSQELDRPWINLKLEIKAGMLRLDLENSKTDTKERSVHAGGIGLENTRKRLALLYPQRHQLQTRDLGNRYQVHLGLQWQVLSPNQSSLNTKPHENTLPDRRR